MKPTLTRYFFRRIATIILLLWIAVWALLVFFDFLRDADSGALSAFTIALLESPRLAMDILPFACAIGCAIAMRRMVSEGEMPALRTAGLSPQSIVIYQIIAILPFAAGYILLSETLLPGGSDIARIMKNEQSGGIRGLWLAQDSNYIHIDQVQDTHTLVSVVIYHTDSGQLTGITRAAGAVYNDNQWVLDNVRYIDSSKPALQESRRNEQLWQLALSPSSFTALAGKPREMAAINAMRAAASLSAAGQQNSALEKIIWQRWLTLAALPLLAALGVQFIGGSRRQRYAVSLPVLAALLMTGLYIVTRDLAIQTAIISNTLLPLLLPLLLLTGYLFYSIRRASTV